MPNANPQRSSAISSRTSRCGFVSTRYQGSKARHLPFLKGILEKLDFDSALDLFSGTASVAYLMKRLGKSVTTNDTLRSAAVTADALIVNEQERLSEAEIDQLFVPSHGLRYDDFVARTFSEIYFLDDENRQIDLLAQNIGALPPGHKKSLALHALYQACLKKRPYNLFHRKNLVLRTRNVARSFGNKVTWERPLRDHLAASAEEANQAVFASGRHHSALRGDALQCEATADLVYIDPPYLASRGYGTDYLGYYHFLEGVSEYEAWPTRVDRRYPHLPYQREPSAFQTAEGARRSLQELFARHSASILVVSYRSDGRPSPDELRSMLRKVGKRVTTFRAPKTYALSRVRAQELVFVGK